MSPPIPTTASRNRRPQTVRLHLSDQDRPRDGQGQGADDYAAEHEPAAEGPAPPPQRGAAGLDLLLPACSYYLLEDDFECWLINATHMHNVPGKKTDVLDAEWGAELIEHGLVRPSFVPPRPIRELRDLTRYRKSVIEERGLRGPAVAQGARGRRHQARVGGLQDPDQVGPGHARRAYRGTRPAGAGRASPVGRMRAKIPSCIRALEGHFVSITR
jgi:hypothetical protein